MTRFAVFSLSLLSLSSALAASDMQGMDHSQMGDMQSMDDGMMQPAAPTESRTPIPKLTDADRAAVFTSHGGHQVHDSAINTYFLADTLEWQNGDDASTLAWDLSGWIGGDIDRLWLRSEGERSNGKTEDAEIQALWGHDFAVVGRGQRRAPGLQTRRPANLGRVRSARHGAVQLRSRGHCVPRRKRPERGAAGG